MKNYKNNFKKNKYRGNGDRPFKRNGHSQKFNNYSEITEFKRKKTGRNFNANRLIEKYTELAKEALSNGDKILSENYNQHADHFIRISEQQSLEKVTKKIDETNNSIQANDDLNKDQDNINLK
tara:strand:- start:1 stop:369 length:369 start_codon:yes stop_codon:yes gene_type:complete